MHGTPEDVEATADVLLEASRALVAVAARSLADVDITLPQYRALVLLARPVVLTVSDLADALDIHPSSATRLCDRLERKQLVERQPGVSPDRRETTLTLTPQGRHVVGRVTERRRRDLATIVAAMTPEERSQAINGLEAFARAAGEFPVADPFGWADPADDARGTGRA